MPITRKQQILAKQETSEGVSSSPGAADALLVYEPSLTDDVQTNDRVPAGSSLSRDIVPMGRKSRTISFQSDFRGSGDATSDPDEPDWSALVKAAAFTRVQPIKLPVTSIGGTSTGFQVGEIVQKTSAIRGVVLGCFSGSTVVEKLTVSGDVIIGPITGTFTTGGTLTGESSGTTATIGTVANYNGWAYKPTSAKTVTLTASSGFTGGSDPRADDVVTIKAGGVVTGNAQVVSINAGGTSIVVSVLWGPVAITNTVHFGGASATITSAPEMSDTPSTTIRHNLDGRNRDLVGARGDFELTGEAGGPMSFAWTFTGDPVDAVDALPVTTSGLSSIRAPRLFGAICTYGRTMALAEANVALYRLPTKSISLSASNTINPNLDANASGGATGANVADRDPTLAVTVDQVHSAFDWEAFRDDALTVHAAVIVGTTAGNICGVVVPNGQVLEATLGDADGVATHEVQIRPRRVLESGDDELWLVQL